MKAVLLCALCFGCCLALSGCSSTSLMRNLTYTDTGVNKPDEFPVLRATGYAIIARQPGPSAADRDIQAMRASKMEAYRELTEQVVGIYVKAGTSLNNTRQSRDSVSAEVEGFVHGARVIRQYVVNGDTYATELELDTKVLYDLYDIRGAL